MTEPPFRRIAVYGLGLIGGSIALAVKRRWPGVGVIAIDRTHVVQTALRMGMADEGSDDLQAAADADLLMLAAPVLQNIAALTAMPGRMSRPILVSDVGSTKRAIVAAAAELPPHIRFIGGHPLSGAAVSGVEAARPDLFDDRPWILTPAGEASPAALEALTRLVTGMRAVPRQMDPEEHDRLLAYISHLPQLAVSALMHVVGARAGEDGLSLAGRGLRDTTRLASSPPATWRDIVATNPDYVSQALDDLIGSLERLKCVATENRGGLDDVFMSAARWKGVLDHNS